MMPHSVQLMDIPNGKLPTMPSSNQLLWNTQQKLPLTLPSSKKSALKLLTNNTSWSPEYPKGSWNLIEIEPNQNPV